MLEEDVETFIKVVIVGNGAVGKSSMIQRYCKGIYTKDYKKTIGVDFLEKRLQLSDYDVRLMLWDTAGQEEFDAITKAYYRGAQACVIAYSLVDRDSYDAVKSWKKKVENEVGEIITVLVANKLDLTDGGGASVSSEESQQLAEDLKLELFITSVKDNYNIDQVFEKLTELYLHQLNESQEEIIPQKIVTSDIPEHINGHTKPVPKKPPRNRVAKEKDFTTIVLRPSKQRGNGVKKTPLANMKCTI